MNNSRISSFLQCIGLFLIYLFALFVCGNLFRNLNLTQLISALAMAGIFFCVNKKKKYVKFIPPKSVRGQVVLFIITGVGLSFFNAVVMVLLMLNGKWEESMNAPAGNLLIFTVLAAAGAAAEELFFRGAMLNLCRDSYPACPAIIIQAVIFSLSHFSFERTVHTFVCGILFGYFYYYTDNIYTSIIMHVVTNLMWSTLLNGSVFAYIGARSSYLTAACIMTAAGLIIIVCTTVFFIKKYGKSA